MAIIVDPDLLDREQVIFGTNAQRLSIRDIGTETTSALNRRTTGAAVTGSRIFTDSGAQFVTWGVNPGNSLVVFTNSDAGHYVIESVNPNGTALTASVDTPDFNVFTGSGGLTYSVHHVTGGTAVDGVTEQAVYSFAKEEWRVDTETFGGDNLIRHQFPFEAITREQMEIGGGTSHGSWAWFNEYTRKKVRTGGWAKKNVASTTQEEWTGVVTLGSLDADTQVYYQPFSASATPVNFTFQGPVNEAVKTFQTASNHDTRSFLKLFARKKARTYSQATISDIGVTSIETIVNRFPLAHATDPAITADDGAVSGSAPYRAQRTLVSRVDGSKTLNGLTFTSAGASFITQGVSGSDTLHLTTGNEQGYYTVANVDSATQLTLAPDADFSLWTSTESSLSFDVTTTDIIRRRNKDLRIQNSNGTTGWVTATLGGFNTEPVSAGDLVHILEAGAYHHGVYQVLSRSSDSILSVDTTDQRFPNVNSGTFDFKVTEPGMYLQFKKELLNTSSAGTVTFNAGTRVLTRSVGNWGTDGISTGSVITVAGTTSNNGLFTVLANPFGDRIQLVATDTLVNEATAGALIQGQNPFKRVVNGVTYGFNWRVTGNDTTLDNVYQFIQHQLRQSFDIDHGVSSSRGDVTDLLMSFASPTATTFNMYIDDLSTTDVNNVTFRDATSAARTEKFIAAGSVTFNANLQTDASARYAMFFTNDDAGLDIGRDYGTPNAILVQDNSFVGISGSIGGVPSVSFTYDYDGNTQRGATSAGTDAPVTVVAIGLNSAQFVLLQGTIQRNKANNFALVAALERNYSNPA